MRAFILACALATAVVANEIIDGEYIISIATDSVNSEAKEAAFINLLKNDFNTDVQRTYPGLKPLSLMYVKADEKSIARVRGMSEVLSVEPNQMYYTTQTCSSVSCPGVWGLDRCDQAAPLGYSSPSDPSAVYDSDSNSGAGSTAYIVDTGIRFTHNDFGSRAVSGWDFHNGDNDAVDDNGHGTHCAGTVGGTEHGVSKAVDLVGVKVLGALGSGSTANVIAGIDYVAAETGVAKRTMNLSLGGGSSAAMDAAIAAAHNAGVTAVCAAGNSDADACNSSPGSAPECITVGATEVDDQTATYTNYGSCVDIFAPGTSVLSTWHTSDTATNSISGTSMACPHVVGAASFYLGNNNASPDQVAAYLTSNATPNVINFRPGHALGSPDLLLFRPC